MRILTLTPILLSLFVVAPVFAERPDLAELFPADTFIYVEVGQPAEMAKQLAAFVKGTAFENALPVINRLRDKQPPGTASESTVMAMASSFLGPEMLKETSRFHGLAAGLVGLDKHGDSAYLAILLPGESHLPGFVMRAFLSAHPSLRKIATVEGIDLYREGAPLFLDDPLLGDRGGDQAKQESRFSGPVFAYEPGIILLGSDQETIAASIRRHKGKGKSKSLAANKGWLGESARRDANGLFLFANTKTVLEWQVVPRGRKGRESPGIELLRQLLPATAVGILTARLELSEQGIDLRGSLHLDANASLPLADILSGPSIALAALNGVPQDAPLAITLNLPVGEQRLPWMLSLLDSVVKATGTLGPSASEMLRELEEKKLLATAALARIDRIALVLPATAGWPKGKSPLPTILVQSSSPESLVGLADAVPAVLELLGGQKADAVTETIEGVKVRSLEAKASPLGMPIHYAQRADALAIGSDRQAVIACLIANPQRGVAALPEMAVALNSGSRPSLLGVCNWADLLLPRVEAKAPPTPARGDGATGRTPEAERTDSSGQGSLVPREVLVALHGMPPLIFTAGREKNELRFELRQRDPRCLRAKAIERWFEAAADPQRNFYGRAIGPEFDGPVPALGPR